MAPDPQPPICDYEGSDYQTRFWEKGGRAYEDGCEALALHKLIPQEGTLLLELGAGAGRNTLRYKGFERVCLLDYSQTQLQQARQKLGDSNRYIYVAADIYHLPFKEALFDAATMIRVLHHMVDAPAALRQVRDTLQPGGIFILEFANKHNLKAILRYLLGLQDWSPFTREQVEYAALNFDFHPLEVQTWLEAADFQIQETTTVSHFRISLLKKLIPIPILVWLDSLFHWTGKYFQLTPSVFIKSTLPGKKLGRSVPQNVISWFKCPHCGSHPLSDQITFLECSSCQTQWPVQDGIYVFKR